MFNAATETQMLESILCNIYGVGPVSAPTYAILWAVEQIADRETAKAELKRVNAIRAKHGVPLAYAPYNSHAF